MKLPSERISEIYKKLVQADPTVELLTSDTPVRAIVRYLDEQAETTLSEGKTLEYLQEKVDDIDETVQDIWEMLDASQKETVELEPLGDGSYRVTGNATVKETHQEPNEFHSHPQNTNCTACEPVTKEEDKWTSSTTTVQSGPPFPCGCTDIHPHSHLVAGHECPCEKGRPELVS